AERGGEGGGAGGWEAGAGTCAPSLVFEDRRRLVRIPGDRDMFIAAGKLAVSSGPRLARIVLATAGDRLALARLRWSSQGALAGDGMGIAGGGEPQLEIQHPPPTQGRGEGRPAAVLPLHPHRRPGPHAGLVPAH